MQSVEEDDNDAGFLKVKGYDRGKQPTCSPTCNVTKCESKHCITCKHLVLGSSNLTNKNYNIVSPNDTMD